MPVYQSLEAVNSAAESEPTWPLWHSKQRATGQGCLKSAYPADAQLLVSSSSQQHAPGCAPFTFTHPHPRQTIFLALPVDLLCPNFQSPSRCRVCDHAARRPTCPGKHRIGRMRICRTRVFPRVPVAARPDAVPAEPQSGRGAAGAGGIAAARLLDLWLRVREEVGGNSECLTRRRTSPWDNTICGSVAA